MKSERCEDCTKDALIKSDYHTYCAECYMKREVKNARTHTPRSRTFKTSPTGSRSLSGQIPSHGRKAP